MPSTNLPFIRQEMVRYGMTTYLALGLLGNICNAIIFTRSVYRGVPSSVYFLALSIFSIMYLMWAAFPAIYTLYHVDYWAQSVTYCKVKMYGTHTLGQCLRYVIVFACMDRYLVTRNNVRIRSFSSIRTAITLILVMWLGWLLAAMHLPILMNIRNGVCSMSGLYKSIYPGYQITFVGILPPLLMSIFSVLTIRSLHQRHNNQVRLRQRDRHLMRMVIAEVAVNVFTSIPYSAYLIYDALTYNINGKSTRRREIESFISFVTVFLIYLISVAPFYLFLITSKSFRNECVNIILQLRNKFILRPPRIAPGLE